MSGDPRSRAMLLCFPRGAERAFSSAQPFPHRDRRSLGLVGAHLGSALRLRSVLRPASDDPGTVAVFSEGGKLLHATESASATQGPNGEAISPALENPAFHDTPHGEFVACSASPQVYEPGGAGRDVRPVPGAIPFHAQERVTGCGGCATQRDDGIGWAAGIIAIACLLLRRRRGFAAARPRRGTRIALG